MYAFHAVLPLEGWKRISTQATPIMIHCKKLTPRLACSESSSHLMASRAAPSHPRPSMITCPPGSLSRLYILRTPEHRYVKGKEKRSISLRRETIQLTQESWYCCWRFIKVAEPRSTSLSKPSRVDCRFSAGLVSACKRPGAGSLLFVLRSNAFVVIFLRWVD